MKISNTAGNIEMVKFNTHSFSNNKQNKTITSHQRLPEGFFKPKNGQLTRNRQHIIIHSQLERESLLKGKETEIPAITISGRHSPENPGWPNTRKEDTKLFSPHR